MEANKSIDSKEQILKNVREAGKINGLHEDTNAYIILKLYSKRYLEYVRGERDEP